MPFGCCECGEWVLLLLARLICDVAVSCCHLKFTAGLCCCKLVVVWFGSPFVLLRRRSPATASQQLPATQPAPPESQKQQLARLLQQHIQQQHEIHNPYIRRSTQQGISPPEGHPSISRNTPNRYSVQQNQQLVTNGTSNSVEFRSASERVEQRREDCPSFRRLQQQQQFSKQTQHHSAARNTSSSATSAITSISRGQVSSSSLQFKAPSPEATNRPNRRSAI
ncbi:hypothetical protein Nepgr_023186 [Nepenthes gracilis]|uniref:Uncharacterized protein n=1 Tax=Nepenthes gracilis TaxID=150966 RepID=A0AAD3XYT2_NEPGR|nr:hypothetical protein Nepgr_023186 [Nepenthes gracilis]